MAAGFGGEIRVLREPVPTAAAAAAALACQALAAYPVVWAGGGDEHTMFSTNFDELVKITGGTTANVD